jgi:hypothetical protein
MAANRYGGGSSNNSVGGQSSSVTSSIPGLAPAFSGSTSQYSNSQTKSNTLKQQQPYQSNNNNSYYSSKQQPQAMPRGPPPGFLSPMTSSSSTTGSKNIGNVENNAGGGRRRRSRKPSNSNSQNRSNQNNTSHYNNNNNSSLNSSFHKSQDTDSEALKLLMMNPDDSLQSSLSLASSKTPLMSGVERPILPAPWADDDESDDDDDDDDDDSPVLTKKQDWLLRMNRRLQDVPIGDLDPSAIPLSAVMNAWAKTKSSQGASMVELWLNRAQQEYEAGNDKVVPTTKMYTMAGKTQNDDDA